MTVIPEPQFDQPIALDKENTQPMFDDDFYQSHVLKLPPDLTETQLDEQLAHEACALGVSLPAATDTVGGVTQSFSMTTIDSDANNKTSIVSNSTAPTSCSSSDHPPLPRTSLASEISPPPSVSPSVLSDMGRKRENGFRKGIRRMAVFRKRKTLPVSPSTLASIESNTVTTEASDRTSRRPGTKSSASVGSNKGSVSLPTSTIEQTPEGPTPPDTDHDHLTTDSKDLEALRAHHLEEQARFLEYQRSILSQIQAQHREAKRLRREKHRKSVDMAIEKNLNLIEDLESRQLEEEMRLHAEFDIEKRAVMVRLKHMEAYCQHPTPPPTPVDSSSSTTSSPASIDHHQQSPPQQPLPSRKVTEKDYHSLAAQYRERDAMDSLHSSKINVLRGKQKKAVETFTSKREHEVLLMERAHDKEVDAMDDVVAKREEGVLATFGAKRARLETRWKLQALIERGRMEEQRRMVEEDENGMMRPPGDGVVGAEEEEENKDSEIERQQQQHLHGSANGTVVTPTPTPVPTPL